MNTTTIHGYDVLTVTEVIINRFRNDNHRARREISWGN